MPLQPGTTLGPYSVTAKIGEGGMGEVYRARDTKLDRDVALKVLPQAFTDDPDRLARFEREAKVLASLNHPNIGHIYGLEEADGVKALVLELIEGPTLADRIKQGPLPVDEALPIAKQIAEALEAAHEQGIIHRDLKPANIKLRPDGAVKVLDFGLAKALDTAPEGDPNQSPTLTAAATQVGVIMGTAAYMSPEQARGEPVDKRTDIWAFGTILYEMCSGERAFQGEDISLTLASVMKSEVNTKMLPPGLPDTLRNVIRQCLQRDTRQRVADMQDVRLAMKGAFETPGSSSATLEVAPERSVWQASVRVIALVTASVLIGGLAVWLSTLPPALHVVRFQIPLAADQILGPGGRSLVAISPDGTRIVYEANEALWLRALDQLYATQIPGTEQAQMPFFAPDGQSIGFWANNQLKRVSLSGGAPVTVADDVPNPRAASWGVDDVILYSVDSGIMQTRATGETPELLFPAPGSGNLVAPQMLPGGEWVMVSVRGSRDTQAQVVAHSLLTDERRVLVDGGSNGIYLPPGHLVYALDNELLAVPFDVDALEATGGPVPLIDRVRQAQSFGVAHFAVSASGSLVYVPATEGDVVTLTWADRDGNEEPLSMPPGNYATPRVAPDGTRVAVDIVQGDDSDVWIWNLARERLDPLTFHEAIDNTPLWTPDSTRVVFGSTRDDGRLLWKAVDGTGQAERLMDGNGRPYAWTRDRQLVFQRFGNIGVLDIVDEGAVTMLLDEAHGEVAPALSPDGRWLAYESRETGTPQIIVRPFPEVSEGRWSVSVGYGAHPVWAPDGTELFYRTQSDLMVVPIETEPTFSRGTPEALFSLSAYGMEANGTTRQYDVAPDGRRFLLRKVVSGAESESFNGLVFVENWIAEVKARVPDE